MNTETIYHGNPKSTELTVEQLDERIVRVTSQNLPATKTPAGIEEGLTAIGVYTKVASVIEREPDYITFRLKPATVLEIRSDSGTLKKRPITSPSKYSVISKQRDSYRYSATVPVGKLKEIGVKDSTKVSIGISNIDGHLGLTLSTAQDGYQMTARCNSGGAVNIPGAIGSAGDIDGHGVQWEYDNEENRLVGKTTVTLDSISPVHNGPHKLISVTQKQQQVSTDGRDWEQEHFQTYVPKEYADTLGWEREDLLDMSFGLYQDSICLVINTNLRDGYTESTPCVKKALSFGPSDTDSGQLNFYIPNSIVRGMGIGRSLRCAEMRENSAACWSPKRVTPY